MRPMATRAVGRLRRMRSCCERVKIRYYKQDWEPKDSVVEGRGYDQDQTSLAEMPDESGQAEIQVAKTSFLIDRENL